LVDVVAAVWLFHRRVLREKAYLRRHYGRDYLDYRNREGRYF
jgi:protein-S-isoprenylcysteine O-methyltransferase Ste14